MNTIEQNHILIQSASSGSGTSDLYVFIPKVDFGTAIENDDQIYLYTAFGEFKYDGEAANSNAWGSDSGDEEWAVAAVPQAVPSDAVPEPSSALLLLGTGLAALARRKR